MKYVWVQYYPGDAGTFFVWFINQHCGFIENRVAFEINTPVRNEVICDPMMWHWEDEDFVEDFLEGRLQKHSVAGAIDLDTTRICFKTYPHHNLHVDDYNRSAYNTEQEWQDSEDWEEYDRAQQRMARMVQLQYDLSTVQLTVSPRHQHYFIKRMAAAFDTFEPGETAHELYRNRPNTDYPQTYKKSWDLLPEARHEQIDIGELLYEKNEAEYTKLCEFLEMAPNPNWKLIMDFYRVQVFENY